MKKLIVKYRELIIYFIVGVMTTLVNWAAYALAVEVFGWSITLSNVFAWVTAVLFAFVTNKIWVFRSFSWDFRCAAREAFLFVSARLLTGALEMAGVPLLVRLGLKQPLFGVKGMWAKVVVSAIVMVLNYVFSKLFIFKGDEVKSP
jgi:putative flippase GtrA